MILPSCSIDEADESTDHCSNHGSDGLICWWHWWHWWADCTDGADFLSIMHNRFWWHSHASCTLMLFILISCHFNSFHLISFQLISYQSSHPCNLMLMQLQLPMSLPWHSHWQIWVSLMPISWKTNDVSCFVDHSSLISHIFSHKTICRLSSLAHWLHQCWYHLSPCAPTIVNQSFLYCFACISCNPMKHIIVLIAASACFFILCQVALIILMLFKSHLDHSLDGQVWKDMIWKAHPLHCWLISWFDHPPKSQNSQNLELKKCFLLIKFFIKINGLRSSQRVPL